MISHCFFADDALFFLKASKENCECMRSILDDYCFASGHEANLKKSGICFSKNSSVDDIEMVCNVLGIASNPSLGIYLGLPVIWERSKHNALAFIKDRMTRKIQGWKGKILSQAGREVMIKSVVNVVPSYVINCFKLPSKTCKELDSMVANFWWGQQGNEGRVHWVAWQKLTQSKNEGSQRMKVALVSEILLISTRLFWVNWLGGSSLALVILG